MRSHQTQRILVLILLVGVSPIVGNVIAAELGVPGGWFPLLVVAYLLLVSLGVANEVRKDITVRPMMTDVNEVRAALLEQWREEFRLLGLQQRQLLAIPWGYEGPVRKAMSGRRSRMTRRGHALPHKQLVRAMDDNETRGLVLTGPSGSGKSTALMLTAMELAGAPGTTKLPLLVGLKSWSGSQTSAVDLAVNSLMSNFSGLLNSHQAEEIVQRTLGSGDLVLMFDELEELEDEIKVELLDSLRVHAVKFIVSSELPFLQPSLAAFADGFAQLEIYRVQYATAYSYLADTPSGVATTRLQELKKTWEGATQSHDPSSPFAEPLSISIIREIIEKTDSAPFAALMLEMSNGSPDLVRRFLLRWYVQSHSKQGEPDEADLRAVFLPSQGFTQVWWQMGDRVPVAIRSLIAVVIGSIGGALSLFSFPVAGASLGAAFLLVRAVRSGRSPIVFSLKATIRRSLRLIPAAALGGIVGLSGLFTLMPDLRAGSIHAEDVIYAPLWLQLALGPALVAGHLLNSGSVLVGHGGRENVAMKSSLFFGARSFTGGLLLTLFAVIFLGPGVGWATASLVSAFGSAMARSETTISGLHAVTPRASFSVDRRNGWVQAAGFGIIITAGCMATFWPASGLLGAAQAIALGAGAAMGNSVLSGSYGRWRMFTWPYLAFSRGHSLRIWRTVERFHRLGIIKYAGSAMVLRHSSLWSALPSHSTGGDK